MPLQLTELEVGANGDFIFFHFQKGGVKLQNLKNEGKIIISIHTEGKITDFFKKEAECALRSQ
jgi:hypothetical protein